MNWILVLLTIFVMVIQVFSMGLSGKPHRQVILENTLPKDQLQAPSVLALVKRYRQRLSLIATIVSLASLSLLIVSYDSIVFALFFLFLFGGLFALYLCQVYFIRQMHQLKITNHWELPKKPPLIDTKLILEKNRKMVSFYWYLPAIFIYLIGSFYFLTDFKAAGSGLLVIISGICITLLITSYWAIAQIPVRPQTDNATINQQHNDLTKHVWSKLMILTTNLIVILIYVPYFTLQLDAKYAILIACFFFITIFMLVFYTFYALIQLRKKQDALLQNEASFRYDGQDKYWRYGFYYNPDDRRVFIPDRVGLNLGMNFGRPVGKIVAGIGALLTIGMLLFVMVPLYLFDFSSEPFTAQETATAITFKAPFAGNHTIQKKEIEQVAVLDTFDLSLLKTNGFATDTYYVGRFSANNKPATLYIDTQDLPILEVKTKKQTYYYTSRQKNRVNTLYQELIKTP